MTKIYIKLIAMSLALILSVSMVIMTSYAWLVLSGNPVATGIQVAIGGGNTILTAPDIREVATDGTIYHYPGYFSDRLNFGQRTEYTDLQGLGNLTPVSTTNGIDWFLPTYYSGNDTLVQQGKIPSGTLRDVSEFIRDSELSYANLTADQQSEIEKGSYIYLDFWVVSPGGDYTLRVSSGEGTSEGGSFVIDLVELEKSAAGYSLEVPANSAAAAVRVGFLANDLTLINDTMVRYQESPYSDERFTALRGMYQEPNTGTAYLDVNRFTIYEPNGDYHPFDTTIDGSYVETKALELVNGVIQEQERSTADLNLTVQKKSTWAPAENDAGGTAIEQQFTTSLFSLAWNTMDEEEVMDSFYGGYLQGQFSKYVDKGRFLGSTYNLIGRMRSGGGKVSAEDLTKDNQGATDDVYIIKLERNVPQRIRMFIWLEGQDVDCIDKVASSSFAVNIELAGGSDS